MTTDTPTYTLLTGASSTIGATIATRLSKSGPLILSGRNVEKLEEARDGCDGPDRHRIWAHDLAEIEDLPAKLEAFMRTEGVLVSAFVHCAGVPALSAARTVTYARLKKIADVNFASAALIAGTLIRKPVNRDALRHIIFISSIFSRMGVKGQTLYCATKAALDGLMRGLAVELAPAVRVNSVLPGAIPSPMGAVALSNENTARLLEKNYPLGLGAPEAVASAVEFLLSANAGWITGQEIVVDGGRTISHPFE
jgi:NAD(P)-dependent dehydrogenase (short-subunit alcohol dehydrogenase family)